MLAVEPGRGNVRDEKLRAVSVWAGVRHRKHAGHIVAQFWVKFIPEFVTRTAAAGAGRVAALGHKIRDNAVENGTVVEALAGEKDKIIHGVGNVFGIQVDDDVAFAGMQGCLIFLGGV